MRSIEGYLPVSVIPLWRPRTARPPEHFVVLDGKSLEPHFAIQMCREIGLPLFPGFSAEARETLLHYRWPGNIRELKTSWSDPFTGMEPVITRWMR